MFSRGAVVVRIVQSNLLGTVAMTLAAWLHADAETGDEVPVPVPGACIDDGEALGAPAARPQRRARARPWLGRGPGR